MPLVKFRNIAQGINKDISAYKLPSGVWSDGDNVRFIDGAVAKTEGYQAAYDSSPPAAPAHFMIPVPTAANYIWVAVGLDDAWKNVTGTWTEITRIVGDGGDFTGGADDRFTGGVLGGLVIINNGVDAPQMWDPATANFVNLDFVTGTSTWKSLTYSCKAMRVFRSFLVAMDVDKNGTRDPYMVKWSNAAVSGAVPATWDETDSTDEAGEYSLIQTGDFVIDCHPLRRTNIVYKEEHTWTMDYIGGDEIFSFSELPFNQGIMGRGCVAEIAGMHAVKTLDDFILHDGRSIIRSITNKRWRKWIQDNIDTTNYARSYVVPHYAKDEIWLCFPESGASFATRAIIWNYKDDTIGTRDLPDATHISFGAVDPDVDDTWSALTGTWAEQAGAWNKRFYNPTQRDLLMSVDGSALTLYQLDSTNQDAGSNLTAWVERKGIPIIDGVIDLDTEKEISRVYPIIEGTEGGVVSIKVGYQDDIYDAVTWADEKDFTIGTDKFVDARANGRLLAVRIESNTDIEWRCQGFDLVVEITGEL